jgi:preprotein translocase subunit YajC
MNLQQLLVDSAKTTVVIVIPVALAIAVLAFLVWRQNQKS